MLTRPNAPTGRPRNLAPWACAQSSMSTAPVSCAICASAPMSQDNPYRCTHRMARAFSRRTASATACGSMSRSAPAMSASDITIVAVRPGSYSRGSAGSMPVGLRDKAFSPSPTPQPVVWPGRRIGGRFQPSLHRPQHTLQVLAHEDLQEVTKQRSRQGQLQLEIHHQPGLCSLVCRRECPGTLVAGEVALPLPEGAQVAGIIPVVVLHPSHPAALHHPYPLGERMIALALEHADGLHVWHERRERLDVFGQPVDAVERSADERRRGHLGHRQVSGDGVLAAPDAQATAVTIFSAAGGGPSPCTGWCGCSRDARYSMYPSS